MNDETTYGITAQELGAVIPGAVQATDTSSLIYNTSGQERYRLDSNGNLGIGGVNAAVQISNQTPNHNIVFHGKGGKEAGRFDFNDGNCTFEGDASESAKVFTDRKSTRLNSSHMSESRMPSSA